MNFEKKFRSEFNTLIVSFLISCEKNVSYAIAIPTINNKIANLSKEYILEQVLRRLISFSIGKDVFGTTFVLPFGDNYITQEFDVADLAAKVYTLDDYLDLE